VKNQEAGKPTFGQGNTMPSGRIGTMPRTDHIHAGRTNSVFSADTERSRSTSFRKPCNLSRSR
jgi:hypothetical protein